MFKIKAVSEKCEVEKQIFISRKMNNNVMSPICGRTCKALLCNSDNKAEQEGQFNYCRW